MPGPRVTDAATGPEPVAIGVIGTGLGVFTGLVVLIVLVLLLAGTWLYRKAGPGQALVINKIGGTSVTFTGAVVLPVVHQAEYMDLAVKTVELERSGKDGLLSRDQVRFDIRLTFYIRVNRTVEDVREVAWRIGTARASDRTTLQELFNARFTEALRSVGKQLDFVDLYTRRAEFRDRIVRMIGTDLNGYSLEDAAIDSLEQTLQSPPEPATSSTRHGRTNHEG